MITGERIKIISISLIIFVCSCTENNISYSHKPNQLIRQQIHGELPHSAKIIRGLQWIAEHPRKAK